MASSEFRTFASTRPIAIIGMGVMGTKVAWATARAGIPVQAYDSDLSLVPTAIERALGWCDPQTEPIVARNLCESGTLAEALRGVQLAFENVPEDLELKNRVLADLDRALDPSAYLGTNTSSLLCSALAAATQRPERFFALNFSDPRFMRLVELMGNPATDSATLDFARAWARAIGMIPITVRKEQMGYCFNRLWRVIKKEVLRQIAEEYTTPRDIDRAWMLAFGVPYGPCGLMDEVGLRSIYKVEQSYFNASGDPGDRPPSFLKEMVDANQLGVATGIGFYRHPTGADRGRNRACEWYGGPVRGNRGVEVRATLWAAPKAGGG